MVLVSRSFFRHASMISLVGAASVGSGLAFAGTLSTRAAAADAKVATELAQKNEGAAKSFEEAKRATERGDHLGAYNLLEATRARVPDYAPVLRRTAFAAFRIDRRDEGLSLARKAVALEPVAENQIALAQLLLQTEDREDGLEASGIAVKAADGAPDDPLAQGVCAVVTAKWGPRDALHRCTNRYLATANDEAEAHFYGAVAALDRNDAAVAQREIAKAKELGLAAPMVDAVEAKLGLRRAPVQAANQGVASITKALPLAYPLCLALLYLVRARLRARLGAPLTDPRGGHPIGDRLDRAAFAGLLGLFFGLHFVLVPLTLGLLTSATIVVAAGREPSTVLYAIALLVGTGLALFLVRGVAADDPPVDAVAIPKRIEDITREVAERVGTYPAEILRWEAGRSVDVREETSLLGRGKGEAVRTLVLGEETKQLSRRALRAAIAHAHARLATKDVRTSSAASLRAWLVRTSAAVPSALLVRAASWLVGPVLQVAAERQAREADTVVTYWYGATALGEVLGALGLPAAEREARVAAAQALRLTPRANEPDDLEDAAGWFVEPVANGLRSDDVRPLA
jgi:tetratricopeptide (TPR) repeat protein